MDYIKINQEILDEWREKFIKEFGSENEWKFAPDGIMNQGEYTKPDENGVFWRKRSQEGTKEND